MVIFIFSYISLAKTVEISVVSNKRICYFWLGIVRLLNCFGLILLWKQVKSGYTLP